ncbi:MAG: hypothetical protein LH606_22005 [Cytophagaceae bacterium]|nr:hypothetical protein [Cytophagaceae bacterium]
MRHLKFFTFALLTFVGIACDRNSDPTPGNEQSKAEILKSTGWKLDRVTTTDGQTINSSRLSLETRAIFEVNVEFRNPDITRAVDRVSKQVLNGGTWYLRENETILDVDVTGFKGKFQVIEISRTKLIIRNQIPLDGTKQEANMEFSPAQ